MIYIAWTIAILYGLGLLSLCQNIWRTMQLVEEQPAFDMRPSAGDGQTPRIDVVIPVKDEEAHVASCIEAALAQDYPDFQVIVVNDRSTDGTGRVVSAIADREPRVKYVEIKELPAGLYGKPHAISQITSSLSGEIVFFMDSDLRVQPNCFRAIVRHLQASKLDWLAVMGAPDLTMFWERLLVPLFGAVAYAWYDPRAISDPNSDVAIGSMFMVARRSSYHTIGGHEAVIRAYDEDSALLRLAKKAGQRVSYVLAPQLYTVRFYGNLKKTILGMTRTCVGGIKTLPRMMITLGAINFVALQPVEILGGLGIARACGVSVPWATVWAGMAVVHFGLSALLCRLIYDRARTNRWLSLLHPLGAVLVLAVCLRATRSMIRGGPITWRGTTYEKPAT
ncbi:MAG: glycosyltransferase family 2 protein [Planctomycetota bacterium]